MELENPELEIEDQRPDEKVILLKHQHPWVLSKAGFIVLLLVALVTIFFLIWGFKGITLITLIVAVLIIASYLGIRFFLYRNSLFILTNHRVINILQNSLFKRKVQEVELENIFNLQYKIEGMMHSLLNFGDLELTTVGNPEDSISINNIENPHFIYEKISDARKNVVSKSEKIEQRPIIR